MKNSSKINILFTHSSKINILFTAMTTCCYCAETNNSQVLLHLAAEPATVECKTCKLRMHMRCYVVAHTRRTLVCNPVDKQAIRCATHDTALTAHDNVQAVRLRYLLEQRADFVASEVVEAAKQTGQGLACVPLKLNMTMLGNIARMSLKSVLSSTSIADGGFVQRNVSINNTSAVEKSMRKDGYDPLIGTIAVVEISWLEREVTELKGLNLLPADWEPPTETLVEMCPADIRAIVGSWQVDASNKEFEFDRRRFAVIDGNNRIAAITNILADNPTFMENVSLNAYLVQVNVADSLMVQLASMYCNRLGNKRIADTLADEVCQWQLILDAYCRFNPSHNWKTGDVVVSQVVQWIIASIADIADILPPTVKVGEKGTSSVELSEDSLLRKVRLASKLPPDFVKWLQGHYAQIKSEDRAETYGEKATFVAHFLKMNMLHGTGAPDLVEFLLWRAETLTNFDRLRLSAKSTWSQPRVVLA
jgi:hypothetical protein